MAHRLHYSYPMKTTNDKMNAVAAAVATDLGITPEDAAALLVLVLRTQRPALLAAVRDAGTSESHPYGRPRAAVSYHKGGW